MKDLCEKYHRDFEKVKYWYDGYLLEDYQVYNPKAVVSVCVRAGLEVTGLRLLLMKQLFLLSI